MQRPGNWFGWRTAPICASLMRLSKRQEEALAARRRLPRPLLPSPFDHAAATLRFDPGKADVAALVKAPTDAGFRQRRTGERMDTIVVESTLTCPQCGHVKHETMPVDAYQFFYECEGCEALLKPLPGDCCVFCSYGSVKCPPAQARRSCCG